MKNYLVEFYTHDNGTMFDTFDAFSTEHAVQCCKANYEPEHGRIEIVSVFSSKSPIVMEAV